MTPMAWSGLDWAAFTAQRHRVLAQTRESGWLDASHTNVYGILPNHHPDLTPLEESSHPQAPYRCHVAQAFCAYWQWPSTQNVLVSQGVRHALSLIFKHHLSQRAPSLILPTDVYPVYHALAQEAGLSLLHGYRAQTGLPWEKLSQHRRWSLLVCDPLKPWGGRLDEAQWDALIALARDQEGLVLVDAAYTTTFPSIIRHHLAQQAPMAWICSLSKGWLAPLRAGLVITNPHHHAAWKPIFQASAKNESLLRQAYAALVDHPHRPAQVANLVAQHRANLLRQLIQRGIPHADPGEGYFVATPLSPETLWEKGVLGLPASVFGSDQTNTVLSALPPQAL